MSDYQRLLEPANIGKMRLRNRICLSEMAAGGDRNGMLAKRSADFYVRVAKGGAGLVMVGPGAVAETGASSSFSALLGDDSCIPALADLARRVHDVPGAKVGIQLFHVGLQKHSGAKGARPGTSVSPSPFNYKWDKPPRPLSMSEVEDLVRTFVAAANRAQQAGLDCVCIHGAHGYLVSEFLSPYTNKRTDKYGGTAENRARFASEIIQGIKRTCGPDFPVIIKVNGYDFIKDEPAQISPEYMKTLAPWLEKAGADAIVISAGTHDSYPGGGVPSSYQVPRGNLVEGAAEVRKAVRVPIGVTNRISPEMADKIIAEGKVDLVWIGRGLVADPEMPNKLAAGKPEEIRRCLACNTCIDMLWDEWFCDWKCAINPESFREELGEVVPAIVPKSVLVVGGGPAGCEAARTAALAGNKVTLWEKADRLGGQVSLASLIPEKEHFSGLIDYYSVQLRNLNVTVQLGKEATASAIVEASPDVVVLATGSKAAVARIPGFDHKLVVKARDVIAGNVAVGERVVIIGGGSVGLETALFLSRKGRKVTIIEAMPKLGKGMVRMVFHLIRLELKQAGIEMLASATVESIADKGVNVIDKTLTHLFIPADTVVMSTGSESDRTLLDPLQGKVPQVYLVGDCLWPRNLMSAIYQGASIGRMLDDYHPMSYK